MRYHHIAITCLLLLQSAIAPFTAHAQDDADQNQATQPDRSELKIGPETTFYEGPLRDDGTVDYIAALNRELSEGVTNENNAFVALLDVMPVMAWDEPYRRKLYETLNLPQPTGDEPTRLVPFEDYLAAHFAEDERDNDAWLDAQEQPWSQDELPHVAAWLKTNDKALEALADAVRRGKYWAPLIRLEENELLVELLLPHLGAQRTLARTLAVRANLHLNNGDLAAAWRDVMSIKRFSRLAGREPMTISGLVGVSIAAITQDLTARLASHPDLQAQHARRMVDDLQRLPALPQPANWLRSERFFMLDFFQGIHANPKRIQETVNQFGVVERHLQTGEDDPADKPTATFMNHPLAINHALRQVNDIHNKWLQIVNTESIPERLEKAEAFGQSLAKVRHRAAELTMEADAQQKLDALAPAERKQRVTELLVDLLAGIVIPALSSAMEADAQIRTIEDLELVALALGAYRAEHGEYPEKLDALAPNYLDELPQDRFAEQPLKYKMEEDAVVVYSIGANLKDDGGTHEIAEGDISIRLER